MDSTTAALDYLTYLHEEFGDWLLAIAAYNGGEGRVRRALSDSPNADFFDLDLPVETKRYVPRLLALAHLIAQNEALALPPSILNPRSSVRRSTTRWILPCSRASARFPLDEMFRFNPGLEPARDATRRSVSATDSGDLSGHVRKCAEPVSRRNACSGNITW